MADDRVFRLAPLCGLLALACSGAQAEAPPPAAPPPTPVAAAPSVAPAPAPLPSAALVLTTAEAPFVRSSVAATLATTPAAVTVEASQLGQSIHSFGGAFNEMGWDALSVLPPADRNAVFQALFASDGLRFDFCRVPVGASDYAMDRYTLNETAGDYQMARFSIERDKQKLIPYVKAALAVRPDLRLWASAWTPPTWMKTPQKFDGGAMKDDPKVYAAYALYLLKFVEAYRAEGIDISMLVPQNEPAQLTHYPSADWKPAQYVTFIGDHLGPLLRARSPKTQLFVGTINRDDWDATSVLRDPKVAAHSSGFAIQWAALKNLPAVRAAFPSLFIMQSETECGNNHWQPTFNPERPPNDFGYAAHTWRKFRDFIAAGASSYMLWNLVLDEQGKNLDSQRPWPQNAAVVVDRPTKRVIYTPMYFVTKHFSALVERGAKLVETTGAHTERIAFLNPDGSLAVQLMNDQDTAVSLSVAARGRSHAVTLPPRSFATLLVPKG
jgi:glucosylceramidase